MYAFSPFRVFVDVGDDSIGLKASKISLQRRRRGLRFGICGSSVRGTRLRQNKALSTIPNLRLFISLRDMLATAWPQIRCCQVSPCCRVSGRGSRPVRVEAF